MFIDNFFVAMALSQGMLATGLKEPYAMLRQVDDTPYDRKLPNVGFYELGNFVGVNTDGISVGKPFRYTNPEDWGHANEKLPEACLVGGKLHENPCPPLS